MGLGGRSNWLYSVFIGIVYALEKSWPCQGPITAQGSMRSAAPPCQMVCMLLGPSSALSKRADWPHSGTEKTHEVLMSNITSTPKEQAYCDLGQLTCCLELSFLIVKLENNVGSTLSQELAERQSMWKRFEKSQKHYSTLQLSYSSKL